MESKELEINRFKKKHQDSENQNSALNATVEKLKYNAWIMTCSSLFMYLLMCLYNMNLKKKPTYLRVGCHGYQNEFI